MADAVIGMECYQATDLTQQAAAVARQFAGGFSATAGASGVYPGVRQRVPVSIYPGKQDHLLGPGWELFLPLIVLDTEFGVPPLPPSAQAHFSVPARLQAFCTANPFLTAIVPIQYTLSWSTLKCKTWSSPTPPLDGKENQELQPHHAEYSSEAGERPWVRAAGTEGVKVKTRRLDVVQFGGAEELDLGAVEQLVRAIPYVYADITGAADKSRGDLELWLDQVIDQHIGRLCLYHDAWRKETSKLRVG